MVKYPEKHPFYKYSFYRGYCDYLNEKPAKTGTQYVHYIQLNKELADIIDEDAELQELKSKFLGSLADANPNKILLAQDVLFQVFEQNEAKKIDVVQAQLVGNPLHRVKP